MFTHLKAMYVLDGEFDATVIVLDVQGIMGVDVCSNACWEGSLEGDVSATIGNVQGTQH